MPCDTQVTEKLSIIANSNIYTGEKIRMQSVEYIACKQCKCKYWNDILDLRNPENTRFRCVRCDFTFRLLTCSKCKSSKGFDLIQGMTKKGPRFPNYRFKCRNCERTISIMIDKITEQDLIKLETEEHTK